MYIGEVEFHKKHLLEFSTWKSHQQICSQSTAAFSRSRDS